MYEPCWQKPGWQMCARSALRAPPDIHGYVYQHGFSQHGFHASERGDDTVGNPHRTQISQSELFELILSSKIDKRLPVEQLEATVSQVPPPSYTYIYIYIYTRTQLYSYV